MEALRLLEDVTAARRDLVMAREEERRRLRRDMHDGLGPLLAAVLLQLDTAQAVSGPAAGDPAPLPHARHALEEAIGEVRRLTSGLGPAALDERGLGPALRELAARLGPGAGGPRVAVTGRPGAASPAARRGRDGSVPARRRGPQQRRTARARHGGRAHARGLARAGTPDGHRRRQRSAGHGAAGRARALHHDRTGPRTRRRLHGGAAPGG
ncbi:histidine kinase [Streptomyces sp. S1A(2023)]